MSYLIFDLIENNNKTELAKVLEAKTDLHIFDTTPFEDTPLHLAIRKKQKDIIELLLRNNAPINAKNNFGDTPLHLAILQNDIETVKILLNYNPDLKVCNNNNKNAIALAKDENKLIYDLIKDHE